jgi:hypothetical protein
MDRQVVFGLFLAALLIAAAVLAVSYCGAPALLADGSGRLAMVCLFPVPWSYVLGARPIYILNVASGAALAGAILLVVFVWTSLKQGT